MEIVELVGIVDVEEDRAPFGAGRSGARKI